MIATMNFSLVFLIALTGAANVNADPIRQSSELHKILEDFIALWPKDQIGAIFVEYLKNDKQVQAAIKYLGSSAFKDVVTKIEKIDDVIKFYEYLNKTGLDMYTLVNKLHDKMGLPPLEPKERVTNLKITGGVAGLIADIKAILPLDKIKSLHNEKLKTSPAFAQFIEHFKSPRFQELVDALHANTEFQEIVNSAKEAGVDFKAIVDLLTSLFGLEFPDRPTVVKVREI